ncbi:hypothetical protein GKZ90_0021930 [Flavobacterium sp. MC2016-06]|uniref:hypothetical protein n=1 Tax=Flavobacterium sp. MC2016-06 TaxID=2676308 RepID=UPI0012BAF79C|nr:hypothetical protein [Flavobacterium sp. MC2016-06]MBU3861134.1 hypothetical protein [Flavobacterium sp. MC2016-06]
MKIFFKYFIIILSFGNVFGQKNNNVELIAYNQSVCDETSDPYRIKPRIISIKQSKDTLDIDIGFATTCCLEYIPQIKFSTDTLYISYKIKDEDLACSCICCYSFNHKIKGINSSKLIVKLYDKIIELSNEKYKTYDPTFTIIKSDTLNLTDKYGRKQGVWYGKNYGKYKDDRIIALIHLFENMKIKDEFVLKTRLLREFYENGTLKSECYQTENLELINCRKWKKNGQEIKLELPLTAVKRDL